MGMIRQIVIRQSGKLSLFKPILPAFRERYGIHSHVKKNATVTAGSLVKQNHQIQSGEFCEGHNGPLGHLGKITCCDNNGDLKTVCKNNLSFSTPAGQFCWPYLIGIWHSRDGFFRNGSIRSLYLDSKARRPKKKKISRRGITKMLKQMRWVAKIKKANASFEERLAFRITKAKRKLEQCVVKLKKFEMPMSSMPVHDPECLTAEEFQQIRRIGRRGQNYVPVGRRGIFGGVVQNMHLHWKKHETVKIYISGFPEEKVRGMAEELARLSGGIVVDILDGDTLVVYRGRNYSRPEYIIPVRTLSKRKALMKSKIETAIESHRESIGKAEKDLRLYRVHLAKEAAEMISPRVGFEAESIGSEDEFDILEDLRPQPRIDESESESASDLELDPGLVCDSDSVFEFDSESEEEDTWSSSEEEEGV